MKLSSIIRPPLGDAPYPADFDATWSEIGIAYMQAADERMNKLGCY